MGVDRSCKEPQYLDAPYVPRNLYLTRRYSNSTTCQEKASYLLFHSILPMLVQGVACFVLTNPGRLLQDSCLRQNLCLFLSLAAVLAIGVPGLFVLRLQSAQRHDFGGGDHKFRLEENNGLLRDQKLPSFFFFDD